MLPDKYYKWINAVTGQKGPLLTTGGTSKGHDWKTISGKGIPSASDKAFQIQYVTDMMNNIKEGVKENDRILMEYEYQNNPDRKGTLTAGVAGSAAFLGGYTGSIGWTFDFSGHRYLQVTHGPGAGGAYIGGGLSVTVTNAKSGEALQGTGGLISYSAFGGSGGMVVGKDGVIGGTGSYGLGLGYEAGGFATTTTTIGEPQHIFDTVEGMLIYNAFYSANTFVQAIRSVQS
ncbi:hypothetical protein LJC56_12085 [Christensenellaceae bacterium OttesenSCG-928-K19]|nr:hypothetical protein [Christensenellaceae bacterium OttesenSCG-928-K19]